MIDHTTTRSKTRTAINLDRALQMLPGVFILIFIAVGTLMLFTKPGLFIFPDGDSWLNGQATFKVEKHFNDNLPLRQAYIDTWGVIEYSLFGQGREGVTIGKEGWLFTTEEFAYYPDEAFAIQAKLDIVKDVKERLAKDGVELVMVVVPAKARIYPDYLKGKGLPEFMDGRYTAIQQALTSAQIPVIALDHVFKTSKDQQLYFKTDTHWALDGATLAAQESAKFLRERGYNLPFDQSDFKTNVISEQSFSGDLTKYVPLGALESRLGFKDEVINESVTVQTDLGLFADTSVPVVLVGSSYSGDARWNFAGALKEALGMNIANAAQVGHGEIAPMKDYLSGAFLNEPKPKVVIWQVSERGFPMAFSQTEWVK